MESDLNLFIFRVPSSVGPDRFRTSSRYPHPLASGAGEGHMIAAADARAIQAYGHDKDSGGGCDGMEEENLGGAVDAEGVEGDALADHSDLGNPHALVLPPVASNQLTLSFHREVYVFDSVSPEKVQAVLLLLGGREIATSSAIQSATNPLNKRSNFPQRVASLMRFKEKRKERNFDKKIRYAVRKEVALRMQRNRGQFTTSKSNPEVATLGATNCEGTQCWGTIEGRPPSSAVCHHCGISSKSTPMMRRGPDGPRTLCNACGLMWANKGTLRDLSKNPSLLTQSDLLEGTEMNGASAPVAEEPQPYANAANDHDSSSL